jgi:hypothetical protein
MEALNKILGAVRKEKGLDDLNEFWTVTGACPVSSSTCHSFPLLIVVTVWICLLCLEQISFPLNARLHEKVFSANASGNAIRSTSTTTTLSHQRLLMSKHAVQSDSDFDYDTSSTISEVEDSPALSPVAMSPSPISEQQKQQRGTGEVLEEEERGRQSVPSSKRASLSMSLSFSDDKDDDDEDYENESRISGTDTVAQLTGESTITTTQNFSTPQATSTLAAKAVAVDKSVSSAASTAAPDSFLGSSSLLLNSSPLFATPLPQSTSSFTPTSAASIVHTLSTSAVSYAYSQDSLLPFSDSPSLLSATAISEVEPSLLLTRRSDIASPPKEPLDTLSPRGNKSLLLTPESVLSNNDDTNKHNHHEDVQEDKDREVSAMSISMSMSNSSSAAAPFPPLATASDVSVLADNWPASPVDGNGSGQKTARQSLASTATTHQGPLSPQLNDTTTGTATATTSATNLSAQHQMTPVDSTHGVTSNLLSPPLLLSSMKKSAPRRSSRGTQRVSFEGLELSPIETSLDDTGNRKPPRGRASLRDEDSGDLADVSALTSFSRSGVIALSNHSPVPTNQSATTATSPSTVITAATTATAKTIKTQGSGNDQQTEMTVSEKESDGEESLTVSETSGNEQETELDSELENEVTDQVEDRSRSIGPDSSAEMVDTTANTSVTSAVSEDASLPIEEEEENVSSSQANHSGTSVNTSASADMDMDMDMGANDMPDMDDEDMVDESMSRLVSSQIASSPLTTTPRDHDQQQRKSLRATPGSTDRSAWSSNQSMMSTPGSAEFPRGRKLHDSTFLESSDESDNADNEDDNNKDNDEKQRESETEGVTEGEVSVSFVDKSFLRTIADDNTEYAGKKVLAETKRRQQLQRAKEKEHDLKKKAKRRRMLGLSDSDDDVNDTTHYRGSDEDNEEEHDDYDDEDGDEGGTRYGRDPTANTGLRRSRRATKGRRLQYWKGERCVYNEGTLVGISDPIPTPAKAKSRLRARKQRRGLDDDDNENDLDFDENQPSQSQSRSQTQGASNKRLKASTVTLPRDVEYLTAQESATLSVWDNVQERPATTNVVCISASLGPPRPLPVLSERAPGKEQVGFALPLLSAKEMEGLMPGWTAGEFWW